MGIRLKNWRTTLLLLVTVPAGFFTAFTLLSFLMPEAQTETIQLKPAEWRIEKSYVSTDWPLWLDSPEEACVSNFYMQDSASAIFTVIPLQYTVDDKDYGGSSVLHIALNLTVNVAGGFIERMRIYFYENYDNSLACLRYPLSDPYFYAWENIKLENYAYAFYNTHLLNNSLKAFIDAEGLNNPTEAYFRASGIDWILKAPENMSQQLKIIAEVTFHNGTSRVRVAIPIILNLDADVSGTFEESRVITPGNYTAHISAIWEDPADCYRIWLIQNQTIEIQAFLGKHFPEVTLSLYDPLQNLAANVTLKDYLEPRLTDKIISTVKMEGYWYIKLTSHRDNGIYKLIIKVSGP